MKITHIEVYGYDLSYRDGSYVMSGNQVVTHLASTVVRIIADNGLEGWGEVCPLGPLYLESHAEGARAERQLVYGQEFLQRGTAEAQKGQADVTFESACGDVGAAPRIKPSSRRVLKGHINKVNCVHFSADSR